MSDIRPKVEGRKFQFWYLPYKSGIIQIKWLTVNVHIKFLKTKYQLFGFLWMANVVTFFFIKPL